MAVAHPGSLRGMTTGRVGRGYAERHHPGWSIPPDPATIATGEGAPRAARLLLGVAVGCSVIAAVGALLPLRAGQKGDGPAAVARRFQRALEGNDLERAYHLLSPAARSQGLTPEAFFRRQTHQQDDRYLDPGQSEPYATAVTVHRQHRAEGAVHVALTVRMSDGRTNWRQVDLSRTGGGGRVDHFARLGTDPCGDARTTRPWGCPARSGRGQ